MAWEVGWNWLNAGQTGEYWVSWGDTEQGLQYIVPDPRGNDAILYTVALGRRSIPQFGAPPRISYWVRVFNAGPAGTNFVLRGHRVDS
jgi:hypothetical protein